MIIISIQEKIETIATNVPKVYEAGKRAEYISFWDSYMNGIESSYTGGRNAFAGDGWNDITFNPTRDIYTSNNGYLNCQRMFGYNKITDLKGILERNGVKLSTKKAKNFDSFAYQSTITRFPLIDMANADRCSECFTSCSNLKSIDKIILSSTKSQVFTSTFTGCSSLEEIRFEGYIRSNVSFAACALLSHDSVINADNTGIINVLYDFKGNGDTSTHTLTLHADAKARLDVNTEIAVAVAKGWTVA